MKGFLSSITCILTKQERTRLLVLAWCDLVVSATDVFFLATLLLVVRIYTNAAQINGFLSQYRDLFINYEVFMMAFIAVMFCIKNLLAVLVSRNQHRFVYGVSSRLSEKKMLDYLRGSYSDFVQVDSSIRIRQISQVPIEFSHYVLTNLQQIIAQSLLILFTVVAILLYHPVLFVLLLILLLPPVVLLGWLARHQIKKVRSQIKQSSAKVFQYLNEALAGYVESNIYSKHQFFAGRYQQQQEQLNRNLASQQTLQGVSSRFIEIFAVLGFFVLIAVNKITSGRTGIDVLTIGVFMAAAYKIIPGIVKILNSAAQMKTYSFTLQELDNEQVDAAERNQSTDSISSIKFENVDFGFNDELIADKLSFEINAGDVVGMSARSGKGKTTVINLLLGFLEEQSGVISINGQQTVPSERKKHWDKIAYVKQQPFFINDTILKNITLSDDLYDKDQLDTALQISGLDNLLKENPEGVHKMILENGKNISGGQRQRVALARALYRNHDLLILDEPFSELDEEAEREIMDRLLNFNTNGRAVLIITHNKSALAFCNKIVSP